MRAAVTTEEGGFAHGADLRFGGHKVNGIGRHDSRAWVDQYPEVRSAASTAG